MHSITCENLKERSAAASPLFTSSTAIDDLRPSRLESGLYHDIVVGKLQVLAHLFCASRCLSRDWLKGSAAGVCQGIE